MKKLKGTWITCVIIYIMTLIYAFYVNWQGKYFGMTFVACVTPFIVPVFMKLIKVRVPLEFHIVNIIFVYFASLWGSCLGGYQLPYYDKFTHFASGVVICEMIFLLHKHYLRHDHRKSLMFIFLNAVNASVALLWEFYEYALLVFFQYDAIKHFSTGVHDTITDMLVAVIGGLILSIYLIHYDQSEKNHFFVSLERKIHKMNH
ncbi:MAG: DUF2238 domain-containing protein [Massilimicrobiota sp.]|nr:DUF2238 domain-containing protein [Massilimicrobiota sp.]